MAKQTLNLTDALNQERDTLKATIATAQRRLTRIERAQEILAEEGLATKRRGRPVGSKNKTTVATAPANGDQPVKRGPGRPRKNPLPEANAQPVKRGPGRPRKNPQPEATPEAPAQPSAKKVIRRKAAVAEQGAEAEQK